MQEMISASRSELTCRNHALLRTERTVTKLPQTMQEVLQLKFKDKPGEVFAYKPDPQIMVYLLEDLYGKEIISIAEEKLFQPLGISEWEWSRDDIENLKITVDDLMKIAKLYLNKGVYEDQIIFSEEFYQSSIRAHSDGGFPERKPYGYYWWLDVDERVEYFYGSGFGGQIMCVIPKLDASVIIVSTMDRPHLENRAIIREIITMLSKNQKQLM